MPDGPGEGSKGSRVLNIKSSQFFMALIKIEEPGGRPAFGLPSQNGRRHFFIFIGIFILSDVHDLSDRGNRLVPVRFSSDRTGKKQARLFPCIAQNRFGKIKNFPVIAPDFPEEIFSPEDRSPRASLRARKPSKFIYLTLFSKVCYFLLYFDSPVALSSFRFSQLENKFLGKKSFNWNPGQKFSVGKFHWSEKFKNYPGKRREKGFLLLRTGHSPADGETPPQGEQSIIIRERRRRLRIIPCRR